MLRDYIWSLTFVVLLLGAYTFLIWTYHSSHREPAGAVKAMAAPPPSDFPKTP